MFYSKKYNQNHFKFLERMIKHDIVSLHDMVSLSLDCKETINPLPFQKFKTFCYKKIYTQINVSQSFQIPFFAHDFLSFIVC